MNIIIADDHHLIAQGFVNMIHNKLPGTACRSASDLSELQQLLTEHVPDILFQDVRFGKDDARDFIKEILESYPSLKMIIISSLDDSLTIKTLLGQGVKGYILKSDSEIEIFNAIQSVMEGQTYISPEVKRLYTDRELFAQNQTIRLTPREKSVLDLIIDEKSSKEIALELSLTEKSIENYRSNLLLKFGAKNVAGLVKKALMQGHI
ncbi:MAG: response regulator transcription factor [Ginsengibacter sp.]